VRSGETPRSANVVMSWLSKREDATPLRMPPDDRRPSQRPQSYRPIPE
jgi:hypothetical protein